MIREKRRLSLSLLIWCGAVVLIAGWVAAFTPAGAAMILVGATAMFVGVVVDFTVRRLLGALLAVVLAVPFVLIVLVLFILEPDHASGPY